MSAIKAVFLFFGYALLMLFLLVGCLAVAQAADIQADRAASKMVRLDPASPTFATDKAALCRLIVADIRSDTLRRATLEEGFQPKNGTLVNDNAFSAYVDLANLLAWENKVYYDNCLCN